MHFFGPYTYRSSFGATTDEEERERSLAHLAEVITRDVIEPMIRVLSVPAMVQRGWRKIWQWHMLCAKPWATTTN